MKSIGSKVVLLAVLAVVGFAYYDYQKSTSEESDKLVANRVFPNRLFNEVAEIKIHSLFGDIAVHRDGKKWQMTVPVQDSADTLTVEMYINSLLNQEMKKVETETGSAIDWSQYGLDKPDGWVEVSFNDKSHSMIQVGTVRAVADGHYLRQDNGDKLLVGSAEWTSIVNRPPGEFRNKSMFDLDGHVLEFKIVKNKDVLQLKEEAGVWAPVLGAPKDFETDQTKVKDFVVVVGNFKVDLVASDDKSESKKWNLEKPYLDFTVKSDKEERTVSFSKGKNGKIYAVSSARNGIFEVSAEKVNSLMKSAKDFKVEKSIPTKEKK